MNMIGGNWSNPSITCFCTYCERKGLETRGLYRCARQGCIELDRLFAAAGRDQRPTDGYFVTFWRLALEYLEILVWEKLWTVKQAGPVCLDQRSIARNGH
jgi:hypothetical protein